MKKTKKKAENAWFGNPLFVAALITIMAVVAFILADDWINLQNTSTKAVVPQATVKATPSPKPFR